MSAADETLLSELCTICHINPPKYRCPRCGIRTCSLPCTRKHKKWASCSGVRDPAAYLPRNQLATPTSFDRDFNFITGIERGLERAEREASNRGIELDHEYMMDPKTKQTGRKRRREDYTGATRRERPIKGELGFLRAAQESGVNVVRAPRGLTRQRENHSRVHQKHKCLNWTVEWIAPSSGQRVIQSCLETVPLRQAYDRAFPSDKGDKAASNELESTSEKPDRSVYFYLHRPRAKARQTVLAPVQSSVSLSDALRGRTVVEFPTIYVLAQSPAGVEQALDEEYMLEGRYLKEHPDENAVQNKKAIKEDDEEEDYTSSEGSSDDEEDEEEDDDSSEGGEGESEDEDESASDSTSEHAAAIILPSVNAEKVFEEVLQRDLSQAS